MLANCKVFAIVTVTFCFELERWRKKVLERLAKKARSNTTLKCQQLTCLQAATVNPSRIRVSLSLKNILHRFATKTFVYLCMNIINAHPCSCKYIRLYADSFYNIWYICNYKYILSFLNFKYSWSSRTKFSKQIVHESVCCICFFFNGTNSFGNFFWVDQQVPFWQPSFNKSPFPWNYCKAVANNIF